MNKEELKPIDVTKFTITESGNVLRSKTMKEELLKKLHTAMCNDNEHQCNRLNNYIHTDEYLTAEVVQVVNEIIAEETKELKAQNKELTLKIDRLESDCDAYSYSQRTYQDEIKELKTENEQIKSSDTLCKLIGEQKRKIVELEAQIEKMKCCINDLVHLGEFNEHTDEEYFNYQVHEALNNAGQFIKEIKEK